MANCLSTVFISYAHADKQFVQRLRTELETRGVEVWVDEKDIRVGESISERIEDGLVGSDYFCLVLSTESFERPWVQREYRAALNLQLSQESESIRILPLKISESSVPPLLRDIRHADFSLGFSAGFQELCMAINLPAKVAPFVDIPGKLGVDPKDLSSFFNSALEVQDMDVLTPIWRSITNGAYILNDELAENKFQMVTRSGVQEFLDHNNSGPGIVLLPPVEMTENVDVMSDNKFGFNYTVNMKGVRELLECTGKWFDQIKSRRLYLAPNSISWDDMWSGKGQKVVIDIKPLLPGNRFNETHT